MKNEKITYSNLIFLSFSLGGIVFFVQQILAELNIHFFHLRIGNLDIGAYLGLALTIWGSWKAFQDSQKSEIDKKEENKFDYLLREIDENKGEIKEINKYLLESFDKIQGSLERQGSRIGEAEQKIYAATTQLRHHEDLEIHPESNKRLVLLEDGFSKIRANVELLVGMVTKSDEIAFRLSKLEQETKL